MSEMVCKCTPDETCEYCEQVMRQDFEWSVYQQCAKEDAELGEVNRE
jgi:hypothetical protein